MNWNAIAAAVLIAGVVGYLSLPPEWGYLALAFGAMAAGGYYLFAPDEGRSRRRHR